MNFSCNDMQVSYVLVGITWLAILVVAAVRKSPHDELLGFPHDTFHDNSVLISLWNLLCCSVKSAAKLNLNVYYVGNSEHEWTREWVQTYHQFIQEMYLYMYLSLHSELFYLDFKPCVLHYSTTVLKYCRIIKEERAKRSSFIHSFHKDKWHHWQYAAWL